MVYSAKHREYQLVAKLTVPCFLTRVIFTMSVFYCGMPPLCPRNWDRGTTQIFGGTLKKIPALCAGVCAPNQNRVGAYARIRKFI